MHRLTLKHCCRMTQRYIHNGAPLNARQAGFGKVIFFLSPFVTVGGVVAYAKQDKDFRDLLEKNVPGAKSVLKFAVDDEFHIKDVTEQFDYASKQVKGLASSITNIFDDSESSEDKSKPATPMDSAKSVGPIIPQQQQQQKKKNDGESHKTSSSAPVITPAAKTTPLSTHKRAESPIPTEVLELELEVEKHAILAMKEYQRAISVLKNFNAEVRNVVDQAVENHDPLLWNALKNKTSARDTAVSTAEQLAQDALERISKCEVALSKAATSQNNDEIAKIRNKVKTFSQHIAQAKDELYKEKDNSEISEKYWRSVEKARNYFIDEIQSIFPGINLAEKKLNLTQDDLDLFITHAYTHVLAYQKELQRLHTDGELRLKRAIEAVRGNNDGDALKAQLDYELEVERQKLNINNQKKVLQIRADYERRLREQLKKQTEAHNDHLQDVVSIKEIEMKRYLTRELEDRLATEKANYKLQLAAMLGKMRGMDAALQARAESERSAHQAQALWAACQALWATVRTGEAGTDWREKLRPLKNEIQAVSKVAEGDELVAVVLSSLPREAGDRGVFPEDALRERFLNVERLARKFALVKDTTASLPMYFLSYLQSIFIAQPEIPITVDELQNKEFDFSKLDTYDILNRARYYVDRGDLLQALKYMNLLTGAPRKIADDWLKETRLLLETQQAANTLMAHAAASGLLYL